MDLKENIPHEISRSLTAEMLQEIVQFDEMSIANERVYFFKIDPLNIKFLLTHLVFSIRAKFVAYLGSSYD